MLDQIARQFQHEGWRKGNQEGNGVMNSRPKQKPALERTIAVRRECVGVSNSTSSRSPGLSRIPAYRVMPPSLISVPRPSTTVVEKPFEVITRTGMSTGRRSQRRVLLDSCIVGDHPLSLHSAQITKVTFDASVGKLVPGGVYSRHLHLQS